jgi:hypothetical protein
VCELFYDAVEWLTDELERILKETVPSAVRSNWENHEKPHRVTDIPSDIRTQHLSDTRFDCYRYADL